MDKHACLLSSSRSGFESWYSRQFLGTGARRIADLIDAEVEERLDRIYAWKRENGLRDVKFTLTATGRYESSTGEVLSELLYLEEAVALGKTKPLNFGDLRWKN